MIKTFRIGGNTADEIGKLAGMVGTVREPDFPEVALLLDKAMDALRHSSVGISFVGQIKAGKSTLINALADLDNFLPTDVNPWTAVITNLHFGHADKPSTGGEFQLFSEEEWSQVLEGDSETRRLAEKLLPGFKTEVLRAQVEEMQATAKARLGGMYQRLLGKTHAFNTVTPEILERYVSAGYQDEYSKNSTAGKFSGITKSASVFMPAGVFAYPVTISDTPGINDPFLVRDEITTTSFRHADIFAVALSVHQPLNSADMALLKMLSVHSGKTAVIFLNRIDELDDAAGTVPILLDHLNERLQKEIANPNYILFAGSAVWGGLARSGSDADVDSVCAGEEFTTYFETLSAPDNLSNREKLFVASGLGKLMHGLSDIIAEGPAQRHVGKAVTEVTSATHLFRKVLDDRLSRDDVPAIDTENVGENVEQARTEIRRRYENLVKLVDDLKDCSNEAHDRLLHNGDIMFATVMASIDLAVNAFVEAQTDSLRAKLSGKSGQRAWKLDTGEIRDRVEQQIKQSYDAGRRELDNLLMIEAHKMNALAKPVVGDLKFGNLLENLPNDEILPGFKPNSTLVEVELITRRGWKFWKRSKVKEAEAVERVKRVIRAEMYPTLKSLRFTARESIAERTGAALIRLNGVMDAAKGLLGKDVTALEADYTDLEGDVDQKTIIRINKDRAKRSELYRRRLQDLDNFEAQLVTEFGSYISVNGVAQTSPKISLENRAI